MLYTNADKLPEKYLLEFYSSNCGPCKTIKPHLEKLSDSFDIVMLDATENMELAIKYGVVSVPTLLLIDGGAVKGQKTGAMPKGQIRDFYNSMG